MDNEKLDLEYGYEGKERQVRSESTIIHHIDSEPGDHTRYRYTIVPLNGRFYIINDYTDMKYPRMLHDWELKEEKIKQISERWDCNPWTVKEVINAIKSIFPG